MGTTAASRVNWEHMMLQGYMCMPCCLIKSKNDRMPGIGFSIVNSEIVPLCFRKPAYFIKTIVKIRNSVQTDNTAK